MQTITPCLWFNGNAEEAANFYVSVFPNSKIRKIMRSGDAGPGPKGSPLMISFMLDGQSFQALNGGPQYKFTEAVSMSSTARIRRRSTDTGMPSPATAV